MVGAGLPCTSSVKRRECPSEDGGPVGASRLYAPILDEVPHNLFDGQAPGREMRSYKLGASQSRAVFKMNVRGTGRTARVRMPMPGQYFVPTLVEQCVVVGDRL